MNYVHALSRFSPLRLSLFCALLLTLVPTASALQAQASAQTQQRPRVQRPAGAAARVPARVVAPQGVEKAVQASAATQRYHFKIEQQPALATFEGDVDAAAKTAYIKITLARQGVPPAEIWIRNGQAYGKHAYLNRYFKVKDLRGFPDYLQAAVALAKLKDKAAWREESGVLKLDVPLDVSATSQKVGQRLDTWLKSAKSKDRHTFLQNALADLNGLTATAQVSVPRNGAMINRLVLQSQSASARRASTILSFSSGVAARPMPAQALRATREIPLGALFYRLRSIGGWCRATHRFFALQSINLIKSEDAAGHYADIYNNGKLDIINQEDSSFNPVIIGSDYEDVEDGDDLATAHAIYRAWLTNPETYLLPGLTRDYRHFGGDGQGLEDSMLFDLRDGESTPDVGDRYYSARDWGWNAPGKNGMTFREAIAQYGNGTYKGKQAGFLMLGHIVHLLQDQAMPDHAALLAHPGSSSTDPDIYSEIPLCDLLAAEIMALGCGTTCLPLDLVCYAVCASVTSAAAASAKLACEEGIDPNEMGYEKVVLDYYPAHYDQANIAARVAQTGSVRRADYNAYFHEVAALSAAEPPARGLTQPLGVGGHPATAIVDYPVDPYIHGNSESEKAPFLALTDAVAVTAITRSAGLMKHFYEIVNPPPYVSSLTIRQNDELRFQVVWSVKADGVAQPYRQATRINKPLYPGIEATLVVQFGPSVVSGYREMASVTLTLNSQPLTLTHKVNGSSHSYQATFVPPCTGTSSQTMQIAIGGSDNSPRLSGRTPLGNQLDRNPGSYALVLADPPYAFVGYEPGGNYTESITVAAPGACWKDVTEYYFCGDSFHWDWWQLYKGQSLEARLKILEQGAEIPPAASASCGRYRLSLGPNIKFHKKATAGSATSATGVTAGTAPRASAGGRPAAVPMSGWVEGPPSQFGLTFALDDPYSMQPKIMITHNQASATQSDKDELEFRVPVILTFEPTSGSPKELCRVEQEMKILGAWHYWKAVNDCIVHSNRWTRWVGPWEEVEIGQEVIRTIDLSKAMHSGTVPEAQRVGSHFAKLQPAGGQQVIYISPGGQSSRETSLQAAKITIARTNDPKVISVRASAQTPVGTYVIPFSAGRGAAAETVVVIKVVR